MLELFQEEKKFSKLKKKTTMCMLAVLSKQIQNIVML